MNSKLQAGVYRECMNVIYESRICILCATHFNIIASIGYSSTRSTRCEIHACCQTESRPLHTSSSSTKKHLNSNTRNYFKCCHDSGSTDACCQVSHIFKNTVPFSPSFFASSVPSMEHCYSGFRIVDHSHNQNNKRHTITESFSTIRCENMVIALPLFVFNHITRIASVLHGTQNGGYDKTNLFQCFVPFQDIYLDYDKDVNSPPPRIEEIIEFLCPTNFGESDNSGRNFLIFESKESFLEALRDEKTGQVNSTFKKLTFHHKWGLLIDILEIYNSMLKMCGLKITPITKYKISTHEEKINEKRAYNISKIAKETLSIFDEEDRADDYDSNDAEKELEIGKNDESEAEKSETKSENTEDLSENGLFVKKILEGLGEEGEVKKGEVEEKKKKKKRRLINTKSDSVSKSDSFGDSERSNKRRKRDDSNLRYDFYIQEKKATTTTTNERPNNNLSSDPFYSVMHDLNDLEGIRMDFVRPEGHKSTNGISEEYRNKNMLVYHFPDTRSAATLLDLENLHSGRGRMDIQDLKKLHVTADGLYDSTQLRTKEKKTQFKVLKNSRATTKLSVDQNTILEHESDIILRPYINHLSSHKLRDDVTQSVNAADKIYGISERNTMFQNWDIDNVGFLPFIVIVNIS